MITFVDSFENYPRKTIIFMLIEGIHMDYLVIEILLWLLEVLANREGKSWIGCTKVIFGTKFNVKTSILTPSFYTKISWEWRTYILYNFLIGILADFIMMMPIVS